MSSAWMIRAGRGAERIDEFLENSVVAIGWSLLPDLSGTRQRKQILI